MKKALILFTILYSAGAMAALPRTVFVELFEWPWNDIARECEQNLGPNGFAAIQVSPPEEHVSLGDNAWWERYQPISYKIYSRSGNEEQFKEMVRRCNQAHVDVYVDAVINHMGGVEQGHGIAGSVFTHYQYDNLYSYNDFHHCGRNGNDHIVNFGDLYELQNCELVNLADLKTESSYVQNTIAAYLNKLISFGVKGFRIDAAKHIAAADLSAIVKKLSAPVYILQELITSSNDPFLVSDYTKIGDVSAYSYPYFVGSAFKNKNFDFLLKMPNYLPDSKDSVVFIDNHDLQRSVDRSSLISASYENEMFDLAQIFMLTYPFGYPQLYSSYQFKNYDDGPPVDGNLMTLPMLDKQTKCLAPFLCEHKRNYVNALVNFRNKSDKNFYVSNWWTNGRDQLAFSRGNTGFVLINNSEATINQTFQTGLPAGNYCNLIEGNCSKTISVNQSGIASINLGRMSALVLQ